MKLIDFKERVERFSNLEAGSIASEDEVTDYVNEAIELAELKLHQKPLGDDYFLSFKDYDIEPNQDRIDLPDNIFANKVRTIEYLSNDYCWYKIKRLRASEDVLNDASNIKEYDDIGAGIDGYSFNYLFLKKDNDPSEPSRSCVVLYPTPKYPIKVRVWYTREAKRLVDPDDFCDMPEFNAYIVKYVEFRIHLKERSEYTQSMEAVQKETLNNTLDVLSQQAPDLDTRILVDENMQIMTNQGIANNEVYE